jgi:putative RNA 2'-phosphotransferase
MNESKTPEAISKESEKLSKKMAFILRHNPGSADLLMSPEGEVSLSELAKALKVSKEVIISIVEDDSKGRYAIESDRIWATQGHSIPVSLKLEKLSEVGKIYHGTKYAHISSIKTFGILPGDRQYAHLSPDFKTAHSVAERRSGASVILEIDGDRMIAEGHNLFRSTNGVILAHSVPWEFVVKLVADIPSMDEVL